MHPLNKKEKMKEQFEKRKQVMPFKKSNYVSFKDLDLYFEPETVEWYKETDRGGVDLE